MSDQPARSKAPPGLRLLVVDDNDDNRNLLSRRLRSKGYEVDLAADGPAALEACAKVTYDAILLDVMMPGMSGIEVLEKLRQKHAKTELSVIMATAKNDSVSVVDALKRGANDYVTKPIDFPVLLARLETQLTMKAEAAERAAPQVDVTFGIQPGTVLCDRYEILEKRGEGGFAVVYRARQLSTNRDVALKHLRPDVLGSPGNTTQLERFELESKLIGELNHPNVVRLIDSGSVSVRVSAPSTHGKGTLPAEDPTSTSSQTRRRPPTHDTLSVPYIVMELLSGESLSELIEREAPLDPTRAVDLVLPILSALSAAHEKDVIHRDVKPSNIMLTPDGRGGIEPKVLDFGIAKLTNQEVSQLTVGASLIGTPQYMPPEQAFGRKDLDGRVDQFSSAAVLYQMLTGRSLYAGESLLELVSKVLAGKYASLSDARPDLSPGLVAVVARALAAERAHRYSSMLAFGRALLPYASEKSVRRWSDAFAADPAIPDSMPIIPADAPDRTAGPTDPTVQLNRASDRSFPATLQSNAPPEPKLPPPPPPVEEIRAEEKPKAEAPKAAEPETPAEPGGEEEKEEQEEEEEDAGDEEEDEAEEKDEAEEEQAEARPPEPTPSAAPVPWERIALIVLATAAVCYALSRYFL